jgi:hypothetical protein
MSTDTKLDDQSDEVAFSEEDLDEMFIDEKHDDLFGDETDELDDLDDDIEDESEEEGEPSPADSPEEKEEEPKKPDGVLTKDGKHVIPYTELEAARAKAKAAEEQLQEIQGKLSESDNLAEKLTALERHNNILLEQLKNNELTPDQLPENLSFSDEELAAMSDYDEIGGVVAKLVKQNNWLKDQITTKADTRTKSEPVDVDAQAVEAAIKGNDSLSQWRSENDPRFMQAVDVDTQLRNDQKWSGRPYSERFNEVVRLVNLESEKRNDAKLDEKIKSASRTTPNSLSDIGTRPSTEKTQLEKLSEMDANAQAAALARMSEREIEALMLKML